MEDLSIRQRQVLRLVGQAMTTKEIARELKISPRTVEVHAGVVREKLGCRNKIEMALYAHGIILNQPKG